MKMLYRFDPAASALRLSFVDCPLERLQHYVFDGITLGTMIPGMALPGTQNSKGELTFTFPKGEEEAWRALVAAIVVDVHRTFPIEITTEQAPDEEECGECGGTGRYGFSDDDVCRYCNGTGWLLRA